MALSHTLSLSMCISLVQHLLTNRLERISFRWMWQWRRPECIRHKLVVCFFCCHAYLLCISQSIWIVPSLDAYDEYRNSLDFCLVLLYAWLCVCGVSDEMQMPKCVCTNISTYQKINRNQAKTNSIHITQRVRNIARCVFLVCFCRNFCCCLFLVATSFDWLLEHSQ